MNIFILTFHKHDKAFTSDLYLIYNRSPAARVCKSDTDRLLMLYLVLKQSSYLPRLICLTFKVRTVLTVLYGVQLKLSVIKILSYSTTDTNPFVFSLSDKDFSCLLISARRLNCHNLLKLIFFIGIVFCRLAD